jgi:hypothetical protein
MRNVSQVCWVWGQVALLTVGTVAQATTFSVKAVKKNPTCIAPATSVGKVCFTDRQCDTAPYAFNGVCGGDITPTNNVTARVGDIMVAEVFVSDWPTEGQRARTWQATLDMDSFFNGAGGAVVPIGWDRPPEVISCLVGLCWPEWPVCYANGRYCAGPGQSPEQSAIIDPFRSAYIFSGKQEISAIDFAQYRFGSTLLDPPQSPVYAPPPKYAATLALEVRPHSHGTFTISLLEFDQGVRVSYVLDESNEYFVPVVLEPLRIDTGAFCDPHVRYTSPPNCAIDARQPSNPNGTGQAGWDSMELTFDLPGFPLPPPTAFSVDQVPLGQFETPPSIESMTVNGDKATLHFNRKISLKAWTCVSYACDSQRFCIGHLPGDVNSDRMSSAVDILKLIDNLHGQVQPPYVMHQCDIDRSGICAPADILRVIDLLNGADVYDPWLGQTIPPCPSVP